MVPPGVISLCELLIAQPERHIARKTHVETFTSRCVVERVQSHRGLLSCRRPYRRILRARPKPFFHGSTPDVRLTPFRCAMSILPVVGLKFDH